MQGQAQKAPFETMIKDLQPETVELLKSWRAPRYAYVLFEVPAYRVQPDFTYKAGHELFTLNVEARPDQGSKIDDYMRKKKARVIHYANFPKLDDPNPWRRARALLYSGPDKQNPWDSLEAAVKQAMQIDPGATEKLKGYEQALREKEAQVQELLAKQRKAEK